MRAIVQDRYGSVDDLRLAEVETPTPADDEVLVRVRAASVHADVWHVVAGLPYVLRLMGSGLSRPEHPIPGTDLAGVVEAVGAKVSRWKPGDEVFGETHRGMQWVNGGAFAEYAAVPEDVLASKPSQVGFEAAATVPTSGLIALFNLEQVGLPTTGQHVLVNGAGGGVGTIALQVAKAHGATVTAVDRSEKFELLRQLGADHLIDYRHQDFTRGTERYDLIFDVASNLRFFDCTRVLTRAGKYLLIGHDHYGTRGRRVLGSLPQLFGLVPLTPFTRHLPKLNFSMVIDKARLIEALRALLESEQLTPVVAQAFPLAEASEALRYLMTGEALGRIVLTP